MVDLFIQTRWTEVGSFNHLEEFDNPDIVCDHSFINLTYFFYLVCWHHYGIYVAGDFIKNKTYLLLDIFDNSIANLNNFIVGIFIFRMTQLGFSLIVLLVLFLNQRALFIEAQDLTTDAMTRVGLQGELHKLDLIFKVEKLFLEKLLA